MFICIDGQIGGWWIGNEWVDKIDNKDYMGYNEVIYVLWILRSFIVLDLRCS